MSYQIKATPFFQRILATSKKSGELQKLKDEYERIQDFDEKAVETKMRQVRLKRLFQEIEDIKGASLKRRRITKSTSNFANEQRLHNLTRAKEMGQYFSRLNAAQGGQEAYGRNGLPYDQSKAYQFSKRRLRDIQFEEAERIRSRVNTRCNYGNEISNWNMQKMLMSKLHTKVTNGMQETAKMKRLTKAAGSSKQKKPSDSSETSLDGKEKLMYRISYGNTISDLNMMLMPKRRARSNLSKEFVDQSRRLRNDDGTPVPPTISNLTLRPDAEENDNEVQDYLVHDNGCIQPLYACDMKALSKSRRAQKRWHKLFITLRYLMSNGKQNVTECSANSEEDQRYKLRSISNDTNIPESALIPEYCQQLDLSDNDDENMANETLLKSERLLDTITTSNATTDVSSTPGETSLPLIVQQRLKLKPVSIPKENCAFKPEAEDIEHIMKLYEPLSMQVVNKEIFETGIQKLREIFEHKNAA